MSNLKDELLRLLREDEGFRIEVMRLLGIINVNASLNQKISSLILICSYLPRGYFEWFSLGLPYEQREYYSDYREDHEYEQ